MFLSAIYLPIAHIGIKIDGEANNTSEGCLGQLS